MRNRKLRLIAMLLLLVTVLFAFTGCEGKDFSVQTKIKDDKVILEFDNETGSNMAIGWTSGEIKITTSDEVYKETTLMYFSIPEGESEIEIDTSEYEGEIEKIELRDVSCLATGGLPKEKIKSLVVYDVDKDIEGYDDGFSATSSPFMPIFIIAGVGFALVITVIVVVCIVMHKNHKKEMQGFAPFAAGVPNHDVGADRTDDGGFAPPPAG